MKDEGEMEGMMKGKRGKGNFGARMAAMRGKKGKRKATRARGRKAAR